MYYADFAPFKVNEEQVQLTEEMYQAGMAWGKAGNRKLPQTFPLDRGDGHVTHVLVVGSRTDLAQAFVQGWRMGLPRGSGR